MTLYPAVVLAAWLGGFGPGVLSTLICALAAGYLEVMPTYSFSINQHGDLLALILFVLIGVMMSAIIDAGAKNEAKLRAMAAERARLMEIEREARFAAESANRMKDGLLAMVSHDLRTPLQGIIGAVQVLRKSRLPAQTEKFLGVIERNARTQERLLEDLIDLSRISTGHLTLNCEYESVRSVVEFVVRSMQPQFDGKHLRVEWTGVGPERTLFIDVDRIQQIVSNLLSNAAKFTPPGGIIRIHLDEGSESQVSLTISDTGIGIHAEFLPYVFRPFHQGETSPQREGLGLGLAIVKDLVELHGGSIEAKSAGPGAGSTFTVRLPVAAARLTCGSGSC
jgi:signal transduction histidine kinase